MTSAARQSGGFLPCPACEEVNPRAALFCGRCGASLGSPSSCPHCGAPAPGAQDFCGACGSPLWSPAESLATASPHALPEHLAEKVRRAGPGLQGERKQVTVLFADVKGSMDLAGSLDPEEWREIMDRFLKILSAGVHRFEGTVDRFTGDGIMALFGAPIAHEDHAARACYAALHLTEQLERYSTELRRERGLSFSVRMGINSGEVVLGALGNDLSLAYTAIGHTVGMAQRMESLAEPGHAYLAGPTASLVEGYFKLRDLGEFKVKGAEGSVRVYELEGLGASRTPMEVSAARGLSRFVGRIAEMAELERAWERAAGGEGQVVGLVAEAGVGKSRLCLEFVNRLRGEGVEVNEANARAHARTVPFVTVLEIIRGSFGITDADDEQAVREKVAGRVLLVDAQLTEALPLIFEFLGIPDPERPAPEMSPEARQRRLFGSLSRLLHAQYTRTPAVLLVEDLNWLDPGSETFLETLIEAVSGTRMLLLCTFRPEYRAEWMERSHCRPIEVSPLGAEATEELLASLLGRDPSLDGLGELVRERAGGNPFFIEEIVWALSEEGTLEGDRGAFRLSREIDAIAIPPTVQSVLAARIDRLPEREKTLLQTAAVIGREFTEAVLARVAEMGSEELDGALQSLVAGEFLYRKALLPNPEYVFKHALTEEVAYRSQLADRRSVIHAAVANAVEALDDGRLDERAALLAHHWEAAGEPARAARWSARAANWAGFADQLEAVRHWRKVRELTADARDGELASLGLTARALLLAFAWRLGGIAGLHDEIDGLLREGEALSEAAADRGLTALLLSGYASTKIVGGNLEQGLEIARRAMKLAEDAGDRAAQLAIVPGVAYPLCILGDLDASLKVTERVLDVAAGDRSLGAGLGWTSPYGFAEGWRGTVIIYAGRLAEAHTLGEGTLAAAQRDGDVETQLWVHNAMTLIAEFKMDAASAIAHARSAYELAELAGGAFGKGLARADLAAAHILREEWQLAIEAIEWALAIAHERRSGLDRECPQLSRLAAARLGNGDVDGAHAAAREALDLALERNARLNQVSARVVLARTRIPEEGRTGSQEIRAELETALRLTREIGAFAFEPQVHRALADLARAGGDEQLAQSELRESRLMIAAMSTPGQPPLQRSASH